MKLFITGGTGFFGKSVLRYLLKKRCEQSDPISLEVTVLSRDPGRFLANFPEFDNLVWLRFHCGDIGDASSLPSEVSFTHIIHAAADSTDASYLTNLQRFDQIAEGTRNLLQFAVEVGAKRFLLTSSGGVYGPQPEEFSHIPEIYRGMPDPLIPSNVYGIAKRQAEHLCALYRHQYGLETVIARCFAFVGPDLPMDAHFAIGNFIRDALYRDAIIVGGDGTPSRTYLYQDDLAEWLLELLSKGEAGKAYNVGSDADVSIAELAQLVRDTLAPHKEVHIVGKKSTLSEKNRYVPDITMVKQDLGLRVKISLPEAIRHTGAILSQSPNLHQKRKT